jgi:MATE family multidrug resistance protein
LLTLLLWGWIWGFGLHRGYWVGFERSLLGWRATRRTLALGLPIGLSFLTEVVAFSGSTFLAARLGAVATAAHTIVLNLAALSFMVPLGVAMAASARVGQLVGRRDVAGIQRTVGVVLVTNAAVMAALGSLLFVLRGGLPSLYTGAADVIALASASLPIVAAFQLADGTQVAAAGLLRGMARTRAPMLGNLIGYYAIGLPLGGWLAFSRGLGVAGIWWGLLVGLVFVSSALVVWVLRVRRMPVRVA